MERALPEVPGASAAIPLVAGDTVAPAWVTGTRAAWMAWRDGTGDRLRWGTVAGGVVLAGVAFGSLSGVVAPTTRAVTPTNSKVLYLAACACIVIGFLLVTRVEARFRAMPSGGDPLRRRFLGTLLVVGVACAGSLALVPTRVRETFWVSALVCIATLVPRDRAPRVIVSPFAVAVGIAALYVGYLASASVAPMALATGVFMPLLALLVWVLIENGLDRFPLAPTTWSRAAGGMIGAFAWLNLAPHARSGTEVLVLGWYVAVASLMFVTDAPRSRDLRVRVAAYASLVVGIALEHAVAYPAVIFPVGVTLACLYFLVEVAYHGRPSPEPVHRPWLHGAILAVAVLCCVNTLLPWDSYHYSFFLFPARDLIAGKSLLADVNAQYGIGIVYLTALLCGWSMTLATGPFLSGALNVLNIVEYLGLYWFTRMLVRSRRVALVLWVAILFSRSLQLGSAESFPSTGPLRFGLGYVAIFLATSAWFARRAAWRLAAEAMLFGIALVFSVEGLASVAVMHLGADVASLLAARSDLRARIKLVAIHRVDAWVAGSVLSVGLVTLDVARRTWALPDWRHYTDYIFVYGGGHGFHQPDLWSPWAVAFLVPASGAMVAASRLALADELSEGDVARLTCGFLVGAYGVLQFSYFVFRPHPNNLFHVMWPAAVMLLWLLGHVVTDREAMGAPVRAAVATAVLVTASLLGARTITSGLPSLAGSGIGRLFQQVRDGGNGAWFNYAGQMRLDLDGTQVRAYLAKYAPDATRFPMLLHDEVWQRAILGTPYVNAFEMSFEPQDVLIPLGRTMAVNSAKRLPFGSLMLVEHDLLRLGPLHHAVIRAMCDRGGLETVERGNHVDVMRLVSARDTGANTTCREVATVRAVRE